MPPPSSCIRGLTQLRAVQPSIACRRLGDASVQTASFSTSAARYANAAVAKKKSLSAAPKRGTKTLNVKKGRKTGPADTGKPPAVGERKAMRKRVVLSNNNALEVSSLVDLTAENVLDVKNEGLVRGIPEEEAVDALRAVEAFKPRQGWSLFRRPAVLYRRETAQLAQLAKGAEEGKKTERRIVTGSRMSGKSTLVLQGLLMAHLRGWAIINFPEGMLRFPFS